MERIISQDNGYFFAVSGRSNFLSILAQQDNFCFSILIFYGQFGYIQFGCIRSSHFHSHFRTGITRTFPLFFHRSRKAFLVDGETLFLRDFFC